MTKLEEIIKENRRLREENILLKKMVKILEDERKMCIDLIKKIDMGLFKNIDTLIKNINMLHF